MTEEREKVLTDSFSLTTRQSLFQRWEKGEKGDIKATTFLPTGLTFQPRLIDSQSFSSDRKTLLQVLL